MRTKEFINRSVFALDEKIGTVKGIRSRSRRMENNSS